MTQTTRMRPFSGLCIAVLFAVCIQRQARAYTAGSMLVLKVGQAAGAMSSSAISLTELTTTGSVASGPVAIDSSICQTSSRVFDGKLTQSQDGLTVSFACYNSGTNADVGSSGVARVIGSVSQAGALTFYSNLQPGGQWTNAPFSSAVQLSGAGSFYAAGSSSPLLGLVSPQTQQVTALGGGSALGKVLISGNTLYATPFVAGTCRLYRIGAVGALPTNPTSPILTNLGEIGPGNTACGSNDLAASFSFDTSGRVWSCLYGPASGKRGVYFFGFSTSTGVSATSKLVYSFQSCLDIAGQYSTSYSSWTAFAVTLSDSGISSVMSIYPAVDGWTVYPIATSSASEAYLGISLVPWPLGTASCTSTQAVTPSGTPSQIQTLSMSPSATATSTPSPPGTSSLSRTPSATPPPTQSPTLSMTPLLSPTQASTQVATPPSNKVSASAYPSPFFIFDGSSTAGFNVSSPAGVEFIPDQCGVAGAAVNLTSGAYLTYAGSLAALASSSLSAASATFWCKCSGGGQSPQAVVISVAPAVGPAAQVFECSVQGAAGFGFHGGSGNDCFAKAPLCTGTWTHAAVVLGDGSPSSLMLFINGKLVTACSLRGAAGVQQGSTVHVGYDGKANGGRTFFGAITHARIFSTALTSAQVAAEFSMPCVSPTQTTSLRQTPTQSPNSSSARYTTALQSVSATSSPAASLAGTPSLPPVRLIVEAAIDGMPPTISDALPALAIRITLVPCLQTPMRVACAATSPVNSSVFIGINALSSLLVVAMACRAGLPAVIPVSVTVGANFGTAGGPASLSCEATASSTELSLARGTVPLSVAPTLWPFFSKAIVVSQEGFMLSVPDGAAYNGSADLLAAACRGTANCTLSSVTTAPASALAVAKQQWDGNAMSSSASLFSSPPGDVAFSITLTGASVLVLFAGREAFGRTINVTLGGVACSDIIVSNDGQWAAFLTPMASALCPGLSDQDCGYQTLLLANVPTGSSIFAGALGCPPYCPGVTGVSLVPFAASGSANGSDVVFAPATPAPPGGLASPTDVSPVSSFGIYYARACSATGLYTDPASGACANASDPRSRACAFGGGDSCRICPVGALCPGGARVWTRPGFYVASESSPDVVACPPPLSASRCSGWNASSATTVCGTGYLQGSYLCSACAPGYFDGGDGVCALCPVITGSWERYKGLMQLIGGVIAFAVVVYTALYAVVLVAGGTIVGGAGRLVALIIWAITTVQVVSQVARVSSPSLPQFMATLYRSVAVLQLAGVVLPPACSGAYPFESPVAIMVVALTLEVAAAALLVARRVLKAPWAMSGAAGLAGRVALTGAVVLYPTAVTDVSRLLACTTVTVSARSLAALDGGASVAAPPGAASVQVALLSENPYIVCWAGSHAPAGRLAVATVPLFIVLFPLGALAAILSDPMLRWHLDQRQERRVAKRGMPRTRATATPEASFVHDNPLAVLEIIDGRSSGNGDTGSSALASVGGSSAKLGGVTATTAEATAAADTAGASPPPDDPVLAPFLAEYIYAAWWFKHVDLGAVGVLAVLQGVLPRPATMPQVIAKATLSCLVLAALLAVVVLRRPYSAVDAWKGPAKVALITLSFGCVLLNASAKSEDLSEQPSASRAQSVLVGSYILFVSCVITAAVLVGSFARSLLSAAAREEATLKEAGLLDPRGKRQPRGGKVRGVDSAHTSHADVPPSRVVVSPAATATVASPFSPKLPDASRVGDLLPPTADAASSRALWGATQAGAGAGRRHRLGGGASSRSRGHARTAASAKQFPGSAPGVSVREVLHAKPLQADAPGV